MDLPTQLPLAQRQVLAAFALGPLVLIGWGGLFRRICGHEVRSGDDLCAACFEGWALLLGALQVWHFFLPVDARASIAIGAVGVAGLGVTLGAWARVGRGILRNLPALALILAAAVWLSELALGGPRHGDAGGYYIPTTLWMHAYPVVIGLGNLFAPYAYNESYFLYAAAAAVGPFAGRPWHLVNSLLLMVLAARGIAGFWRLLSPWHRVAWTDLAYALMLPAEIALALGIFLGSSAPDTGVFLIGAGLFGSVLQVASGDARTARFHVLATALYACAGWTIKVAFAGMAGALLVVVPLGWWSRVRPSRREVVRTLFAIVAIAAFMLVPWVTANVLMSGSPFFPSALGAFDVPWRVRMDVQSWIASDKYMGPVSAVWQDPKWVVGRLIDYGWGDPEVALPVVAGACALVAAFVVAPLRALLGRRRREAPAWWILVPPLVALLFAFRLTPMPRYTGAVPWLFGISAVLVACGGWLRRSELARRLTAGAIIAASAWLALRAPTLWPGFRDFEGAPTIPTDVRRLASGLEVNVPGSTDACWTAPLPCAPHPDPQLALRRPGDLAGGFEIR